MFLFSTTRKSTARISDLSKQITNLGGVPPALSKLFGRKAHADAIGTLEKTLAGLTHKPSPTATASNPDAGAATETLESLIAQHAALEAKIERLQGSSTTAKAATVAKSQVPTVPTTSAQRMGQSVKTETGKSLIEIGVAVYGQRQVETWSRNAGLDGVENLILRNLHFGNLGFHVPGFPSAAMTAIHGEPKPLFGSTRTNYADQSAKLQAILKNS